tara:strand:- start:3209 stop:4477 length:1269 start_codon:yes stop_codon:yes gene_type:complete
MIPIQKLLKMRLPYVLLAIPVFWGLGCAREEPIPVQKKEIIRPVKAKIIQFNPKGLEEKEFSGVAQSDESSTLSFRVSGVLHKMKVEVGDQVKKGDPVAILDKRDYLLRVRDLKGQLTTAQAKLDQITKGARSEDIRILQNKIASLESSVKTARQEYKRVQQLYANDAASKGRLDQAKNSLDKVMLDLKSATEEYGIGTHGGREEEVRAQKFKVESIHSNLEQAQANLKDTKLKAPYNGKISEKHVSNFEQVTEGQKIYTLVDLKHVEIQISMPEAWVSKVIKQQEAIVEFSKIPGKNFKGWVDRIGVTADPATLTYPVVIKIPNPKRMFLPGMSSTVLLKLKGISRRVPTVPIHSIIEDAASGESFVWTVDSKSSTVVKAIITVGNISGDEAAVMKGLKNGDRVVIAGADRLKDGMKIRIN